MLDIKINAVIMKGNFIDESRNFSEQVSNNQARICRWISVLLPLHTQQHHNFFLKANFLICKRMPKLQ